MRRMRELKPFSIFWRITLYTYSMRVKTIFFCYFFQCNYSVWGTKRWTVQKQSYPCKTYRSVIYRVTVGQSIRERTLDVSYGLRFLSAARWKYSGCTPKSSVLRENNITTWHDILGESFIFPDLRVKSILL